MNTKLLASLLVFSIVQVYSAPLDWSSDPFRVIEAYESPKILVEDKAVFQSNNTDHLSDVLQIVGPSKINVKLSELEPKKKLSSDMADLKENSSILLGNFSVEPQRIVNNQSGEPNLNNVMGFLRKFGYLEESLPNSEALYQEEAILDAISTMQRFGGLSPTGKLDNDTLKLLVTPRCGNKDVDAPKPISRQKRYVIGSPGWKKRTVTYFVANWTPKVGSEELTIKELKKAFELWSGYAHLKFVQKQTPDADIIILFGRGYHGDNFPFDGPGYTLAHAYYPHEFGHLGGDIHFDEDEHWVVGPKDDSSGVDFYTVAAHELGHSLGLSHSPVPGSIMFPYYKGYQANLQLDYDDILAMYQLYISRPIQDDSSPQVPDEETTTATTTTSITTTTARPTTARTTLTTTKRWTTPKASEQGYDNESTTISYHGDYETVDEHLNRTGRITTPPPTTTPAPPEVPDICQVRLDAISVLRNELFAFKDQYVWRLQKRGPVDPGYPVHLRHIFWEFPRSVTKIDAVYERHNGHIVFFSGPRYWVFDGDRMLEENQPLSNFGLPTGLDGIDAALVWGKNNKTYLFRKNLYWRYDSAKRKMDPGYPHDISKWRGVPANLDAAMKWTDGRSYFFKNSLFWRFDDSIIKVDDRYPLPFAQYWFGCPEKEDTIWWN